MYPFSNPRKHQKSVRFSDVFRGEKKGALGMNGLKTNSIIVKDKVINKLLEKLERRNHKNLSHFGPIKVSPLKYATQ